MKIIKPHSNTGWLTAVIEGRYVCAKVYDKQSIFGINNGRVSKLCIGKNARRDPNKNYLDQMDFNYDRGLDFNNLPDGVLNKVVSALENLPKLAS